jgi:hypothetical protein
MIKSQANKGRTIPKRIPNNKQRPNKKQTNNTFGTVQFVLQNNKKSFVCPSELLPSPADRQVGMGV